MKYLEIRKNIKSMSALLALGFVTITPLLNSVPALADDDDDDDDRRSYRIQNRNNRVWNNNERIRLRGTVVEDRSQYSFVLRTDDGRRVLVQTGNALSNVSNGDRVVVRGEYNGSAFQARRVRVTDDANYDWNDNNDWNDNYNRVTVRGVVTRDLRDNDEFEIRAENGRTYRVNMRRNEPRRISQGDRVEIIGDINGNVLRAESVRVISNNNGGWNGGWNSTTLSGVVTRELDSRRFEIRDSSGRTVQVIADNQPNRLSRGDRVYLRGRWERNVFRATSVSLNDYNSGYGGTVGSRVNFDATVINILPNHRMLVRGDNGRTFTVQSQNPLRNIDSGDRVRIYGTVVSGGLVRASDINVVDNDNWNNNRDGDDIDFRGTVLESQLLGATLTIRADNGREYRVRGQLGANFRRGDRVRVRGEWNGNVITNASITRL